VITAEAGKPLVIRGTAWSGDAGPVTAVDVSIDAGRTWTPATMRRDQRTEFGWRVWEYRWTPPREAYYAIFARARDAAGNTQPLEQEWNPSGYGWNVVPRIGIVVGQPAVVSGNTPGDAAPITPPSALKSTCLSCHDEDVIRQQRLTRAQWDGEINKMVGWGAKVSDQDRSALLDYFTARYGPRPR
jgi:hypothetical protein